MNRPFRDCRTCELAGSRQLCPDFDRPEMKPTPFCDFYKKRDKPTEKPQTGKTRMVNGDVCVRNVQQEGKG